jgi:O-antigen/teichoic acid export membrane protein
LHATLRIVQQQLPALLVSSMTNVSEAASIVVAQRLTAKMQLFSYPVQQAAYPQFAQQLARDDTRLVRSTLLRATMISCVVVLPFVIAFCLGAGQTLPLIAGADFGNASTTVQLTVLAYSIGVLTSPAGSLLVAAKKLSGINLGVAVATAGQLVASILFVPALGGTGAAIGLLVYYLVLSAIVGVTVRPLLRAGHLLPSPAAPRGALSGAHE